MKRILIFLLLCVLMAGRAFAVDPSEPVDTSELTDELPAEVQDTLEGLSPAAQPDFWSNC